MEFSDIFAVVRWWAVLVIIGFAAQPLTYTIMSSLPDRGYAFSKMVGLLIASYTFWLLGSLGFLNNSLGGIMIGFFCLMGLSIWVIRWKRNSNSKNGEGVELTIRTWLTNNWRYILVVELLFASFFVIGVWIRAQNPAITATEKPMEFAFLNSASRSPSFPPLDPWMSGFAISYYYFGYVMASVIGRIAIVPEQIGFNLAVAWLFAGTAVGAFGVLFNLITSDSDGRKHRAYIFAIIAAIAISLAGNMEIFLEVLHAKGIGSQELWAWLDVRDLNGPANPVEPPRYETSQWWWWRSSRVIHEYHLSGRPEEGLEPIAEFPAFSFILGDLHPHVLALPFAFLSLGIALVWWYRPTRPIFDFRFWFVKNGLKSQISRLNLGDYPLLLITVLTLGGLAFLNTWDVLIHLFIVIGAFALGQWRAEGRWSKLILRQAFTIAILLTVLAITFYLPFYLGFRSQTAPPFLLPMAMRPTRLVHFLVIFAMPLLSILVLIVTLIAWIVYRKVNQNQLRSLLISIGVTGAILIALFGLMLITGWLIVLSTDGAIRVSLLAEELGLGLPAIENNVGMGSRLGWAIAAILTIMPEFLKARISQPSLVLLLALIIAAVIYLLIRLLNRPLSDHPDQTLKNIESSSLPFVLLMIGTAALLVLGPEFVYLRDNFGQRLNTIFKFYYQAWVLLGLAAVFGLDYLLRRFRLSGILATVIYGITLLIALLFPYYAIQSRAVEYQGTVEIDGRDPLTLDGLEYLERQNKDEHEAIFWLRENVNGAPILIEAVGGQYTAYGRVSSSTGIPSILGWPGHEYQWRGNTPEPSIREPAVNAIYSSTNWDETKALLNEYDVDYIYFGSLERITYDQDAALKFDQYLDVAFRNDSVTIYRWLSDID